MNKYVFKQGLYDDSEGAHLTSFPESRRSNERSPSAALLCAGLLRKGMVYELERVLGCAMDFSALSATYYGSVLLLQW